jgi:hypothetical protein
VSGNAVTPRTTHRTLERGLPARSAAARMVAIADLMSSRVARLFEIHPSPGRPARRYAASLLPPISTGGARSLHGGAGRCVNAARLTL